MRTIVETIKKYYKKGIYSLDTINNMLNAGKITDEEYAYIIGEN